MIARVFYTCPLQDGRDWPTSLFHQISILPASVARFDPDKCADHILLNTSTSFHIHTSAEKTSGVRQEMHAAKHTSSHAPCSRAYRRPAGNCRYHGNPVDAAVSLSAMRDADDTLG